MRLNRLTVSNKNSTEAIRVFNRLPNELKVLSNKKNTIKKRIRNWIKDNYV